MCSPVYSYVVGTKKPIVAPTSPCIQHCEIIRLYSYCRRVYKVASGTQCYYYDCDYYYYYFIIGAAAIGFIRLMN